MRIAKPPSSDAPELEDFDLSTLPPERAARFDGFRKRVLSASERIVAAEREITDARNEIETVLNEVAKLVSETESQLSEAAQYRERLKRFLDIDTKLSRMKYAGVRLINSEEYSEEDEDRTRAGAYERVEDLAKTYFPDAPEEWLETVLLKEVKEHLDAAIEKRLGPKSPNRH